MRNDIAKFRTGTSPWKTREDRLAANRGSRDRVSRSADIGPGKCPSGGLSLPARCDA